MNPGEQRKAVITLLKAGEIKIFKEIFNIYEPRYYAAVLRKNPSRIQRIIDHPDLLRYREIKETACFFQYRISRMLTLIEAQLKDQEAKS